MDEIIEQARKLGEAVAASERCGALKTAGKALREDSEATQLESDYAEAARVLQEKEEAGKPLEPEEKRRELELRQKMASHPAIREYLRAQADFQELMSAVNRQLEDSIGLK